MSNRHRCPNDYCDKTYANRSGVFTHLKSCPFNTKVELRPSVRQRVSYATRSGSSSDLNQYVEPSTGFQYPPRRDVIALVDKPSDTIVRSQSTTAIEALELFTSSSDVMDAFSRLEPDVQKKKKEIMGLVPEVMSLKDVKRGLKFHSNEAMFYQYGVLHREKEVAIMKASDEKKKSFALAEDERLKKHKEKSELIVAEFDEVEKEAPLLPEPKNVAKRLFSWMMGD